MKCPYCGKELEQGVLQSAQEINWQKKKVVFNRAHLHEGGVCLAPYSFWKGSIVEAWLCRDCGKVIMDCPAQKG